MIKEPKVLYCVRIVGAGCSFSMGESNGLFLPRGRVMLQALTDAAFFSTLESAELFRQRCKRDYASSLEYEIVKFVEVTENSTDERIESETRLLDPDL